MPGCGLFSLIFAAEILISCWWAIKNILIDYFIVLIVGKHLVSKMNEKQCLFRN